MPGLEVIGVGIIVGSGNMVAGNGVRILMLDGLPAGGNMAEAVIAGTKVIGDKRAASPIPRFRLQS